MQSFSIKEAFWSGWNTFKREPLAFIGAMAIMGGSSIALGNLAENSDGLFELIFNIGSIVVGWWLGTGFLRMALRTEAGSVPTIAMLFSERWDVVWKYGVSSLLSCILILIGLVLLIVPGFILMVALSLAAFFVVEKGMGPIQALKESRRLTKGHRWNIFWFIILAAVANVLLGIITFGVALLASVPITLLAFVHIFRKIDKTDDVGPVAPVEIAEVPPASVTQ